METHGESPSSLESLFFNSSLLPTLPFSLTSPPPTIPTPSQAREICVKFTRGVDFYWQAQALLALQEVRRGAEVQLGDDGRKALWKSTGLPEECHALTLAS